MTSIGSCQLQSPLVVGEVQSAYIGIIFNNVQLMNHFSNERYFTAFERSLEVHPVR